MFDYTKNIEQKLLIKLDNRRHSMVGFYMILYTVQQQSERFMRQIAKRRRSPAAPRTVQAYRSYLTCWILPILGGKDLSGVENGIAREFVQTLVEASLSPATIQSILSLLKEIVASAVDENGNRLYPREWNADHIDAPPIVKADQNAPTLASSRLQDLISQALPVDKPLYAILAGSGLRIAECMNLGGMDTGKNSYWDRQTAILHIRASKTDAGIRQVDLSPELNDYLCQRLPDALGPLFPGSYDTVRRHLQAIVPDAAPHSFRRFRVTHLAKESVPEGLVKFWIGHADKGVTDRYIRFGGDIEARKLWAQKAGLGFELPKETK